MDQIGDKPKAKSLIFIVESINVDRYGLAIGWITNL